MAQGNNIVDLLTAGMKVEALRQKTIASNIANMETPGYRRLDVRFEEHLAKALDSSDPADLGGIEPEIYQPQDTPVRDNGNDVSIEAEVGHLIKNSLRYKPYARIMQKKMTQLTAAIDTGA